MATSRQWASVGSKSFAYVKKFEVAFVTSVFSMPAAPQSRGTPKFFLSRWHRRSCDHASTSSRSPRYAESSRAAPDSQFIDRVMDIRVATQGRISHLRHVQTTQEILGAPAASSQLQKKR